MTTWRAMAFLLTPTLLAGCTKTVQHRVADFYPGAVPTTQPVAKTAVYSIRFLDENGKKVGGIPNSHRLLQAGDHAGFDIDESRGIVAIAANEAFSIAIPAGRGAVWSTTYHKPTQFSKEVGKVTKATAKVAGYVGEGVVEAILHTSDDDDIDDLFQSLDAHLKDQRRLRNRHRKDYQ